MENLIGMYQAHRNLLLEHQEKVVKELDFIQTENGSMDKDTRDLMTELMDTVSNLNDDINRLEKKINRLKEINNQ